MDADYDKAQVEEAEAAILEGASSSEEEDVEEDAQEVVQPGQGRGADYETRKLIVHLRRYAESALNKHLTAFDLSLATLSGMPHDQLASLLEDVQLTVSMRSSNTFHSEAFYGAVGLAEPFITRATPYNITGMSSVLRHDPAVDDILLELSLQSNRYISPEARLAMACVRAAMVTDAVNKRKAALSDVAAKEAPAQAEAKYKDL
jgi:uncharacterized protein (UPF0335 family)